MHVAMNVVNEVMKENILGVYPHIQNHQIKNIEKKHFDIQTSKIVQ